MLIHNVLGCFILLWTLNFFARRSQGIHKRNEPFWKHSIDLYLQKDNSFGRNEGSFRFVCYFWMIWSSESFQTESINWYRWEYSAFPLSASSCDSSQNVLADLRRHSNVLPWCWKDGAAPGSRERLSQREAVAMGGCGHGCSSIESPGHSFSHKHSWALVSVCVGCIANSLRLHGLSPRTWFSHSSGE